MCIKVRSQNIFYRHNTLSNISKFILMTRFFISKNNNFVLNFVTFIVVDIENFILFEMPSAGFIIHACYNFARSDDRIYEKRPIELNS